MERGRASGGGEKGERDSKGGSRERWSEKEKEGQRGEKREFNKVKRTTAEEKEKETENKSSWAEIWDEREGRTGGIFTVAMIASGDRRLYGEFLLIEINRST
jgi:hypothetical protein